jgi:hypothetical protein
MIGELERRELIERYKDDPTVQMIVRVKAVVLVFAAAGLVVTGMLYEGPSGTAQAPGGKPESASVTHTRNLYLERKAAYERRDAATDARKAAKLTEAAQVQRSCSKPC